MASASSDGTHLPWLAGSIAGSVGSAEDVYTWMQQAVVNGLYKDLTSSMPASIPHVSLPCLFFSMSSGNVAFFFSGSDHGSDDR